MELGGKSPCVVFADADVPAASTAHCSVSSRSTANVLAGSRSLGRGPLYDEFVTKLGQRAAAIRIGDPSDPSNELGATDLDRALRQGQRIHRERHPTRRDWSPAEVALTISRRATIWPQLFSPTCARYAHLPRRDLRPGRVRDVPKATSKRIQLANDTATAWRPTSGQRTSAVHKRIAHRSRPEWCG
jgi:hypothetical protein